MEEGLYAKGVPMYDFAKNTFLLKKRMKSRRFWSAGKVGVRITPRDQPVITSKVETSSMALLSLLDSLLFASMSCSNIRFTVILHSRF